MRMSRGITLTVLAGLVLTACIGTRGCGRRYVPDHTWYDAAGNRVEEYWTTDADGKRVPDPFPHDRYGRPWVYDANGNLVPPPPPPGTTSHSTFWWWGGSGYRSYYSSPSYRSVGGGSVSSASPSRSPSSPSSSSPSSSVSRGGFGSTGTSASG